MLRALELVCSSKQIVDTVLTDELDAAFDYNSLDCSKNINDCASDGITLALDCISEGSSPDITVAAMSSSGGVYSTLLPVPEDKVKQINPKVQMKYTLGYTVVGEYFKVRTYEFQAKPDDFEFGKMFWEMRYVTREQIS
jgi:hypothetical protein